MVSILLNTIKFLLIYRYLQNTYWFRRGELTCCPFHSLRLSHCLSKSNRQRQSPRRYEEPYHGKAMAWYDHTRGIYRCNVHDFDTGNLRDYRLSRTERQVNAFIMSCLIFPPWPPCCEEMVPRERLGVAEAWIGKRKPTCVRKCLHYPIAKLENFN